MKTIQELRTNLNAILDADLNVQLYLGVGRPADRQFLRADIDTAAATAICQQFIKGVRSYFSYDELQTLELSNLDARGDTLYFYDMPEKPIEFASIGDIHGGAEPEMFTFSNHSIGDVKALILKISSAASSVSFFKQVFPVSVVKRDQILLTWGTDRFKILTEDVLKILPGFDLMVLDGDFYVANLKKFEAEFSFEAVVQKAMTEVADKIVQLNIVDDAKGYLANLEISKRHVLRAKGSTVFAMQAKEIIDFVAAHPNYGLKVAGGKIQLNSRNSVKFLFKLINEDILKSELTQVIYDSLAKNVFDGIEVDTAE